MEPVGKVGVPAVRDLERSRRAGVVDRIDEQAELRYGLIGVEAEQPWSGAGVWLEVRDLDGDQACPALGAPAVHGDHALGGGATAVDEAGETDREAHHAVAQGEPG